MMKTGRIEILCDVFNNGQMRFVIRDTNGREWFSVTGPPHIAAGALAAWIQDYADGLREDLR